MLTGWAAAAVLMVVLWSIQRRTHNAGIVDVAWSFATGLLGAWFALWASGHGPRRVLVGALAAVWGVRLGVHLWRRVMSEAEDGRYRMLREQWGEHAQRNLFVFFQIQAGWAVMFAAPMLVAAMNPRAPLGWIDAAGLLVWIVALAGESIADRQLDRFRRRDRDEGRAKEVCRAGLWRYSRHPNYFFEWVHWWAYVLFAVGWSWGWLAMFGPVVMLVFLLRITGIPMTEKRAIASRGDAYREYQRTTNKFFPGPPKRNVTT